VLRAAAGQPDLRQIVLLGAGFDCRAHRLLLRPAPVFLEVDRREVLNVKRALLHDRAGDRVRYVPCDFETGALAACLCHAGFQSDQRSFFLWEGVTNYLTPAAVDEVLAFVSSTAPGSVLLFTYVDRRVLDDPTAFIGSRTLRWILRSSQESWTFGIEPLKVGGFLRGRGLRLLCDTSSVDYRARYLGANGAHLRGYEFYRAAVAVVKGSSSETHDAGESDDAQGQC